MNKKSFTREIAIGGQPTVDDLRQLKTEGFRSVINLRRADETSPLDPEREAKAARDAGMDYRHIPVSPQNLQVGQADQFSEAVQSLPKPVFVHCQGGTRAGAFSILHLARQNGWTAEQAFREGEQAGYKCESPALKQFVSSQLQSDPDTPPWSR